MTHMEIFLSDDTTCHDSHNGTLWADTFLSYQRGMCQVTEQRR